MSATALATDNNPLPNIKIMCSIVHPEPWKGSLTYLDNDSLTDENGQFQARYEVVLERSGEVTIEVRAEQIIAQKTITLEALGGPYIINIESTAQVLNVDDPNISTATEVKVTLRRKDDLVPAPFQLIRFFTDPPDYGWFDSDTGTTNDSGQVLRVFNTIPGNYGFCDIIGRLEGDSIQAECHIEIRHRRACSLELSINPERIHGFQNDLMQANILAQAHNAIGAGIPGLEVQWGIRNPAPYKGSLAIMAGDSITDENGQVRALYSVVLERNAEVIVYALCEWLTSELTIPLSIVDNFGNIDLSADQNVLWVPPDEFRQTNITALVVDTSGWALPGLTVRFWTQPAINGFLDSDTASTDVQGRARRLFSSIRNQYGRCTVFARVGAFIDSAAIDIRPQ